MPKRFISTGELDSHVIVPISKQLVFRLIREMNYDQIFQDRIYFQGDFMTDSDHGTDKGVAYITDNRVTCEITPVLNPTAVKWSPHQANYRMGAGFSPYDFNTNPVFICKDINTAVREALIPCTLQLGITFSLLSRANGYDLLNRLYSKYAPGEMIVVSDIMFDYKVPDDIMSLLFYLYKVSKPADVDTTTYLNGFMDWVRKYSANKMGLVYNRQNQKRKEIVIKKNGFQMIGQLDLTSDAPESVKSGQSTILYNIHATYTFQFNRPTALLADFPVVCKNKLVDGIFLSMDKIDTEQKYPMPINEIEKQYRDSLKPIEDAYKFIIKVPWYDDWDVPYSEGMYALGFRPFLTQVFTLDNTEDPEGVTTIDIANGFDVYSLTDKVKADILELGSDVLIPYGNYMLQVFANEDLVDVSLLELNGSVLTIKNRDTSKQYHLVITKREGENGVNNTKRVWIADLIVKHE